MFQKRSAFFSIGIISTLILILAGCDIFKGMYEPSSQRGVDFVPIEQMVSEGVLPSGKITLNADEESAVLEVEDMHFLNYSGNYEIWLYDKEQNAMHSLGTFKVKENGSSIINARAKKSDIENSDAVVITLEEYPIIEKEPSNDIVLIGNISVHAEITEIRLESPQTILSNKINEFNENSEQQKEKQPTEEKVISEESAVIIGQETEIIRLLPEAEDPDNDILTYIYTSPFDSNGEWQTAYGDAGQYDITVTVSDSKDSVTKKVLVVINKKEEPPVITEFQPNSAKIDANEDSTIEFGIKADDVNKDTLTYSWRVDNLEKGTESDFSYYLGFDDSGQHNLEVAVSDGTEEVLKGWELDVKNINRKPMLESIDDITVSETETVKIEPKSSDPDNDQLTFKISEPVGDDGIWETTYDNAGNYNIVVSVSDGTDTVSQDVRLTVENVNRPPVIKGIVKR